MVATKLQIIPHHSNESERLPMKASVVVSPSEKKLLGILVEYRFLTVEILSRLLDKGLRSVQKQIRTMVKRGLIITTPRMKTSGKGRPELILCLSPIGQRVILNQRENKREFARDYFQLKGNVEHQLLINNFRTILSRYANDDTDLSMKYLSSNLYQPSLNNFSIKEKFIVGSTPFEFIPDGVLTLHSQKEGKTLLFFLEADMGTEGIRGTGTSRNTIEQKIMNYQLLFALNKYERYESVFGVNLTGFRVLIVVNSEERKELISRFLKITENVGFVKCFELSSISQQLNGFLKESSK
jgi:hypothetical protein